jgi:hypothetical protein
MAAALGKITRRSQKKAADLVSVIAVVIPNCLEEISPKLEGVLALPKYRGGVQMLVAHHSPVWQVDSSGHRPEHRYTDFSVSRIPVKMRGRILTEVVSRTAAGSLIAIDAFPQRCVISRPAIFQEELSPWALCRQTRCPFLLATLVGLQVSFICSETHELGEEFVGS